MAWDTNWTRAASVVMSPPIRDHDVDGVALQNALASTHPGVSPLTEVQAAGHLHLVGTDHAVFNTKQKAKGRHDFRVIPNGVNGDLSVP